MKMDDFPSEVRPSIKEAQAAWDELEFSMKYGDRVLLSGSPGTGKTTASATYGLDGRVVVRTFITPETCAAEQRGYYLTSPQGIVWLDGPCIQAWRQDFARLVIDEIDQAGGDTIPLLHAILDDQAVAAITLPDGSTIKPGKGFQCFATMNSDFTALPEALRDRFVIKHYVPFPKPAFLSVIPEQIRPFAAMSVYKKVAIPDTLKALKSTRTWVEIGRLTREFGLGFADCLRVIGIANPMTLLESTFGKMEKANA